MIKLSMYLGLGLLWYSNAAQFGGRIIGGRPTQPGDAISVTIYSIRNGNKGRDAFLTTGVAISPKLVLGTAQAVRTVVQGETVNFESHKIGFDSIVVADQTIAEVDHTSVHENYNETSLEFNVAAFHLAANLIETYIPFTYAGNIPIPFAVTIVGYGAPDADSEHSNNLLGTLASESFNCLPVLNSLVYGETNDCLESLSPLAQGDQGGPVTDLMLSIGDTTLYSLVSYWTHSNHSLVIITNLRHPDIAKFVLQEIEASESL